VMPWQRTFVDLSTRIAMSPPAATELHCPLAG
jgi:hypothetical protein